MFSVIFVLVVVTEIRIITVKYGFSIRQWPKAIRSLISFFLLSTTHYRNNTLTQVSLRDNRLDTRAGKALFNAYRHCPYLLELALSADEIGKELWEQFKILFDVKRACVAVEAIRLDTKLTERQSKQLASYAL